MDGPIELHAKSEGAHVIDLAGHDLIRRELEPLRRQRPHLNDAPAAGDGRQTGRHGRGTPRHLEGDIHLTQHLGQAPRSPRQLIRAHAPIGPHRLRHRQRALDDVRYGHLRGAGEPGRHHDQTADGAGPRHQHALPQHASRAAHRMQGDRQGLRKRQLAQADRRGDRGALPLAHHEVFAEHPLHVGKDAGASQETHAAAQVLAPGTAGLAPAAGMRGVDGDLVPRLEARHPRSHFGHRAGDLVPGNQGLTDEEAADASMQEVVHIRAADPSRPQLHAHLARPRLRLGDRFYP